ncbi:hypothetical protein GCM10009579_34230 [Streptomyces javensis]|uniref:Uncharacterized protein n=1 Tax=Streptomyces javensis TaxID=114698 RepID=A0ABP4HNX7_9ACTN
MALRRPSGGGGVRWNGLRRGHGFGAGPQVWTFDSNGPIIDAMSTRMTFVFTYGTGPSGCHGRAA